jgi:hypothetical protein
MKYNIGDILKCVEPHDFEGKSGDKFFPKGAGWVQDKQFKVAAITPATSLSPTIYWSHNLAHGGVYESAVDFVQECTVEDKINMAVVEAVEILRRNDDRNPVA